MLMFTMPIVLPFLLSPENFRLKERSLVSMELPFFIPISAFPVSLLDMGFPRIAGFATLVLDKEPLTISLLMKYGAPLLVSVVFLPDLLWIRGFSTLARILTGSPRNTRPEEGTA